MSSTIHRFTPPTCTLEIIGKKYSLSHWTKSNILKKFQFKLKFDDPRKLTSRQVTVEGNHQDLLQLQTAVNHYVTKQLQSSFQLNNIEIDSARETTAQSNSLDNKPYLKSQGLTQHKLFFGSLTHDSDADNIRLSVVQLFDLAGALEAYQTQIAVLPETQPARFSKKIISLWGAIAAAAIAAIGISTISLKSSLQTNIASFPQPQSKPQAEIPELDKITPPSTPARQKTPKPKLTEPLASADKLPPPPAVDTPKPKPDIPDPADYPLSSVARQSGFANPQQNEVNPDRSTSTIIVPENQPADLEDTLLESEEAGNNIAQLKPKRSRNDIDAIDSESNISNNNRTQTLALAQNNQLQEVTNYFMEKWQPPANLKQSLEYRLVLNADGTIRKVVPLGKASRLYLSQTNIPVNQESFISPLTESESPTIRLLLNPDGRVQAFTE